MKGVTGTLLVCVAIDKVSTMPLTSSAVRNSVSLE